MNTQTEHKFNADIMPTGIESAVVYAPFNVAFNTLTKQGYEVISLAENARLRIQQGPHSFISRNGNWTREGVIYVPNEGAFLTPYSPMIQNSREATEAHRKGEEFYPTKEQIEQALVNSIDFPQENIEIPTDRFDSEQLTVYAFGGEKEARAYGEFLRNLGIEKMPVWVTNKNRVNRQNRPFARQVWFKCLSRMSGLGGYARSIMHGYAGRLCGINEKVA